MNIFTHSKAVALTVLASLVLAPQAQAAQKASKSGDKTKLQASAKNKKSKKTDSVKDAYPEENKPLPLARELYYKLVIERIEEDFDDFKECFYMDLPQIGHAVKTDTPFGLEGHLELEATGKDVLSMYSNPEKCHFDLLILKDKLQEILKDNEAKKASWEKHLAAQTKKGSKKEAKKARQTSLPLIEERYLDRLLSEVNHPKFDRYITSFYTPNWLTFHANDMKKSSSVTPEKADEIEQVHQKYEKIFKEECDDKINNFKVKLQEIYSQNSLDAKAAQ